MEINLANYLNNKEQVVEISISELDKLIQQYPYFCAAYMVLAKKLYTTNDKNYPDVLKKAAIYVSDIEVLEKYITQESISVNKGPLLIDKVENIQNFNKNILVSEKPQKILIEDKKENVKQDKTDVSNTTVNIPILVNTEKSFIEWTELNSYSNYVDSVVYKPKIIKRKIKIRELEGISLLNKGEKEEIEVEFDTNNQQDIIIGDFIEAVPKISIYSASDTMANMNIANIESDDNLKVISENLLEIYLNQGLYKEAIEMCKRLIVKKPEKEGLYYKKLEEIKNLMVKIR